MLFGWEQTLKNQLPKKLQKTLSTIKVQVREKKWKESSFMYSEVVSYLQRFVGLTGDQEEN